MKLKNVLFLLLVCALTLSVHAFAKSSCQLSALEELLSDISTQKDWQGKVLALPEGTKLPLNVVINGDFLAINSSTPLIIEIKQPVYVKRENDVILFSQNFVDWVEFDKFFTGSVEAIATPDESGNIEITLLGEINKQ
jgi:hypothetical protein